MADLTDELDEALKNTGRAKGGIGKDFSVLYSAYRHRRGILGEDYCTVCFSSSTFFDSFSLTRV